MNGETTILDVFNQLNKEELGTERSKVLYCGKEYYVVGRATRGSIFLAIKYDQGETSGATAFVTTAKVDWIGNKPKTKKIYAALVSCETPHENSAKESDLFIINWINKEAYNKKEKWFPPVIKWMPEDEYPPQEI